MTPTPETVIVPRRELDTTAALTRLIECAVAIMARGGRRTEFDAADLDSACRLARETIVQEVMVDNHRTLPIGSRPFRARRAAVGGVS